jgi:hypothetical protein
VEITFWQGQIIAERAGMADNPQNGPVGAMTPQAAIAPGTFAAGKINFTHDALAGQLWCIGRDYFADKLMAGNAGEAVVSALQFKIGIANSGYEKADECEAFRPFRQKGRPGLHPAGFQMNSIHLLDRP